LVTPTNIFFIVGTLLFFLFSQTKKIKNNK
jgi:hypothetical protein